MSQANQECVSCKAQWIEFQLCEELDCSMERACARVVSFWQGELPSSGPCSETNCDEPCAGEEIGGSEIPAVCVYNQVAKQGGDYVFAGKAGAKGIAQFDDGEQQYRIVTAPCAECCCPPIFADSFSDPEASNAQWSDLGTRASFPGEVMLCEEPDIAMYAFPGGGPVILPNPDRLAVRGKFRFTTETPESFVGRANVWIGNEDVRIIAEVSYSNDCAVLSLYRFVNGIVRYLGSVQAHATLNAWHTLTLCYERTAASNAIIGALLTLADGREFRVSSFFRGEPAPGEPCGGWGVMPDTLTAEFSIDSVPHTVTLYKCGQITSGGNPIPGWSYTDDPNCDPGWSYALFWIPSQGDTSPSITDGNAGIALSADSCDPVLFTGEGVDDFNRSWTAEISESSTLDDLTRFGVGTGQILANGTIDFDDCKILPHKDDATCGCCPNCSLGCFQAKDDFDRENVGCCWEAAAGYSADLWEITGSELVQVTPGEQVLIYICSTAPRAFSWTISVWLPSDGDKAGVTFSGLSATSSDAVHYVAELTAGTECGQLRFRKFTRSGGENSSEDIGEYVVIPGLTPATWHAVRLCYNADRGVLSASVLGYAHHVKDVPEPEDTRVVGIYVDGGGDYKFDTARLSTSQESDSYYYTTNDCPCCFVAGCEADTAGALFDECQWEELSATKFLRRVGWFGVNDDCTADSTQRVVITFTAASYGDRVVGYVDWIDAFTNHSAELTLNADANTPGTLKLYKDGVEIAITDLTAVPGGGTLVICYDQATLTAVYSGTRLEEGSEGNGGVLAAVEWDGTVEITGFEQSHHLYYAECPDCGGVSPCTLNLGETLPALFKLNFLDAIPTIGPSCVAAECQDYFSGAFILHSYHCQFTSPCERQMLDAIGPFNIDAVAAWVIETPFVGCPFGPCICPSAPNNPMLLLFYIVQVVNGDWYAIGEVAHDRLGDIAYLDTWVKKIGDINSPPDLWNLDETLDYSGTSAYDCLGATLEINCDLSATRLRIRTA